MSITFDKEVAAAAVRLAGASADAGQHSRFWFDKVGRLSRLCATASRTHIAFLGTAILAKVLARDIDLRAIKPRRDPGNPRAFSARGLCHNTLVPLAVDLGFSLGATGREPLNNQPYFRIGRLGDDTPVHANARPAFDYLLQLVEDLQNCSADQAQSALAAFIAERRLHRVRYADPDPVTAISPDELLEAVLALVGPASEGGRRAQAVVAGLMDAFAGPDRVDSGRINDPSRHHPGDVCVRSSSSPESWEKAFEVRDKPVRLSDIQLFANKCLAADVREAAMVAVADGQPPLDSARLAEWAAEFGVSITVFIGWSEIVEQALFWAGEPKPEAARRAVRYIHRRLSEVEASREAMALWTLLTGSRSDAS